jgi:squalene-associated FAD-dependent desaturase
MPQVAADQRLPLADLMSGPSNSPVRVAIVGGGLAGLAAAVALAGRGFQIELFEAKRRLGGRAGSYLDRESGELIDHCQHVAMGCCTSFLDFCRRTGTLELFERHKAMHFFGPDGQPSDFRPSAWLPAPLHLVPALLSIHYLSWADKRSVARAMLRLARWAGTERLTVAQWLAQQRQSPAAIERFWQVVLVSALGESLDRESLAAARKVFVDGFLAHPDACHLLVPQVSLSELYDGRVAAWLRGRQVQIHLETTVAEILGESNRVTALRFANGSERSFDYVIVALPWRQAGQVVSESLRLQIPSLAAALEFASAPITGVHLWFDRPLTDLPHAVLVGSRVAQWVFARPASDRRKLPAGPVNSMTSTPPNNGSATNNDTGRLTPPARQVTSGAKESEFYYQVVISASHDVAGRDREAIIGDVLADLRAVFPAAQRARLVRSKIITEHDAVFSCRPGLDALRPPQTTAVPNLLLAGDWTSTGWPSTMEGAVRSGYLAAEGLLRHLGQAEQLLVSDLPKGMLVRLLGMG